MLVSSSISSKLLEQKAEAEEAKNKEYLKVRREWHAQLGCEENAAMQKQVAVGSQKQKNKKYLKVRRQQHAQLGYNANASSSKKAEAEEITYTCRRNEKAVAIANAKAIAIQLIELQLSNRRNISSSREAEAEEITYIYVRNAKAVAIAITKAIAIANAKAVAIQLTELKLSNRRSSSSRSRVNNVVAEEVVN